MLVIGLTGPTGAGKSMVAELFAAHGLPILSADAIYHALLVPPSACLNELVARFGKEIERPDGTLDRRALAALVFDSKKDLADLNEIAHRHVMQAIRAKLEALRTQGVVAAVLDAPQLFEAHAERDCNVIVSVLSDPALRIERIMRRDGIDEAAAQKRMAAQLSDSFFRSHSDYVIENNASPDALHPLVYQILSEMGVVRK